MGVLLLGITGWTVNMTTYIIRRLLMGVVIILIVTIMIFLFMRLLPGDPLIIYISQADMSNLSPEQMAQSWEMINSLGDEVLIALTDAYEAARHTPD